MGDAHIAHADRTPSPPALTGLHDEDDVKLFRDKLSEVRDQFRFFIEEALLFADAVKPMRPALDLLIREKAGELWASLFQEMEEDADARERELTRDPEADRADAWWDAQREDRP